MKTLYLIGGPMGVGKTACCKALRDLLPRSVFLDGDWCWDMHPFHVTEETKALVMDNIVHCLGNFLACSAFDHVIFGWVLHQQDILNALEARLSPPPSVRTVRFSLICAPDELRRRITCDVNAGVRQPDALPRALAYLPFYDALSTHKLDTTALSPAETAAKIACVAGFCLPKRAD